MEIIEVPGSLTLCLVMWYAGDMFYSVVMHEKHEDIVKQLRKSYTSVLRQYITSKVIVKIKLQLIQWIDFIL